MNSGKQYSFGDVVLCRMQFVDTHEVKTRPVFVLFEEYDNVVVAGITSNLDMQGVAITKDDGMLKDSVIKLNYIFTTSTLFIKKPLLKAPKHVTTAVREELIAKLNPSHL